MGVVGGLGGAGSEEGRGWGGVAKGDRRAARGRRSGSYPDPWQWGQRAHLPSGVSGSTPWDWDLSLAVAETADGAIDDADSVAEAAVFHEVLAAKRQASRDWPEECDGRRFARLAKAHSLPAARLQLAVGLVGVMRVQRPDRCGETLAALPTRNQVAAGPICHGVPSNPPEGFEAVWWARKDDDITRARLRRKRLLRSPGASRLAS